MTEASVKCRLIEHVSLSKNIRLSLQYLKCSIINVDECVDAESNQ